MCTPCTQTFSTKCTYNFLLDASRNWRILACASENNSNSYEDKNKTDIF